MSLTKIERQRRAHDMVQNAIVAAASKLDMQVVSVECAFEGDKLKSIQVITKDARNAT